VKESDVPAEPIHILVADPISESGLEILRQGPGFTVEVRTGLSGEDLAAAVREHHGLVVRSATKVTADVLAKPGRLKVIGRAGTGVDNIDLEAATRAASGALASRISPARKAGVQTATRSDARRSPPEVTT
jgi:phosphoglycerate dehydrogenase-like enzyme